ncbi:hypothetical protein [Microbaculum marinum]|uniref:Uncharacterized protein n=1 Tax=Microbaculum marinum TaxID=1764581 RepID=A0AAW9RBU0_9HYPH
MSHQGYLIGILGFALLNGMFSPILLPQTTAAVLLLSPGLLISSPHIVAFLAYIIGSTFTIMLAGIPAALYERVTGARESGPVSLWIWLACTALLSLPAVISFLSVGGF